ncbi:MAG: polysaccharide deacetylase family protein [Tyzzerella sp.]|nr:polysaccharide deacetylase family protein [Tyzzerella sp.]
MYNDLEYKNKIVVGLIMTFALLFFCASVSVYQYFLPVVTIQVNSVTIRQDDELPEFEIYADYSGEQDIVLDESTGYSINQLMSELNQGKGYQLVNDVDNTKEGTYALNLELLDELKEKFLYSWNYKLRFRIVTGTVEVLNKYGDWEEGRFKLLDGSYASGWTNLGPETYYFNEEGVRVTGKQEISGNTYYFNKDGKFDTEKNSVNPNRPMIALTFDDGPGLGTERLIEALESHGARATFFMMGTRVNTYPNAVRKMVETGCELGNHTTNHLKLTDYAAEGIATEINYTRDVIDSIVGQKPTMVRPPYGAVNEVVQSEAGVPLVFWSVDTLDWQLKDAQLIRNYVLNTVKDGDIVLMHDIYEATVQATIELIPLLQERGYQLVTVSEMAKARGITLENGAKYYNFTNK